MSVLPSITQGGSPVRESRPPGFVRGELSNECPYRDSFRYLFKSGGAFKRVWRNAWRRCSASSWTAMECLSANWRRNWTTCAGRSAPWRSDYPREQQSQEHHHNNQQSDVFSHHHHAGLRCLLAVGRFSFWKRPEEDLGAGEARRSVGYFEALY
jgi:hypothetical protein